MCRQQVVRIRKKKERKKEGKKKEANDISEFPNVSD
jgi:hypothetical protein